MKYSYAYKTPDGVRHEASMDAESRDAVFEALRKQGIKAIKVVAADGSKANGELHGVRKRAVAAMVCLAAVVAGVGVYLLIRIGDVASIRSPIPAPATRQDTAPALRTASPLPRQVIPGDRKRIAEAAASLPSAPERLLAAFAEPGRPFASGGASCAADAGEWIKALNTPLLYASDEFTESIDLKRIVTRMKNEVRMYLSNGGTPDDFVNELVKRQKLEMAYREKAETKLNEMISALESSPVEKDAPSKSLADAYNFWLKANAQLQSMGIYTLPLPEILRDYQMSLDFE